MTEEEIKAVLALADIRLFHRSRHEEITPALVRLFIEDQEAASAAMDGLTVAQYREFIGRHGAAMCGARTRAGRLCRNVVEYCANDSSLWKAMHRIGRCGTHQRTGG